MRAAVRLASLATRFGRVGPNGPAYVVTVLASCGPGCYAALGTAS